MFGLMCVYVYVCIGWVNCQKNLTPTESDHAPPLSLSTTHASLSVTDTHVVLYAHSRSHSLMHVVSLPSFSVSI